MAKRNGNREVRKPKQDKQAKAQAPTSISQLASGRERVRPDGAAERHDAGNPSCRTWAAVRPSAAHSAGESSCRRSRIVGPQYDG